MIPTLLCSLHCEFLTAGIDVNVKFHNAHAFEPTPEVAVFDLLGIPLVHGWLVDPQDAQAAAVFGTRCVMLLRACCCCCCWRLWLNICAQTLLSCCWHMAGWCVAAIAEVALALGSGCLPHASPHAR
jgi:hypothetical protein